MLLKKFIIKMIHYYNNKFSMTNWNKNINFNQDSNLYKKMRKNYKHKNTDLFQNYRLVIYTNK